MIRAVIANEIITDNELCVIKLENALDDYLQDKETATQAVTETATEKATEATTETTTETIANTESKDELDRSKKFNAWMMVIAIVAMLAAIAGPMATILVSTN